MKRTSQNIPSGEFSHRETLRLFARLLDEFELQDSTLIAVIETLMAFRHVATKIYGFLIDWGKLKSVVEMIVVHHARIVSLFESTSAKLSEASMQNGE